MNSPLASKKIAETLLPNSIEAEQAVLGAIIVDPEAFTKTIEVIDKPDFFYKKAHQLIFECFLSLSEKNENIDILTASQYLEDKNALSDIGGRSYLAALSEHAPIAANAPYYGKIIKQKAILRNMIVAGNEIVGLGYQSEEDLDILVDKAEQLIFHLAESRSKESLIHIADLVSGAWKTLEEREANKGKLSGLNTGFFDLNLMTSGLQKSDLIILAARPAMGKTSFCLNIAENVAIAEKKPVAIFSLEMSKEQLVQRMMCSRAEVDSSRVRSGQLHSDDWAKLGSAMSELGEAPIFIDDSGGISIMEIRGKCRRLMTQNQGQLGLVVIDYLQLLEGRSNDSRINQISEISRGLKLLARELNVPIIALSQLSRAVEARQDKRPMLSDLRESGCLTADTKIYLSDTGEYRKIIDLLGENNFTVSALDENYKLVNAKAKKAFYSGRKKVYKITTNSGNEIKASANHPFLTIDRWKALEELKTGEFIATARELKSGNLTDSYSTHAIYSRISNGLFNMQMSSVLADSSALDSIPQELFELEPDKVADYIARLWSHKGKIVLKKNQEQCLLRCSSKSKDFVLDLKKLLLRFAIHSKLEKSGPKQYHLVISDIYNIRNFVEKIGFTQMQLKDFQRLEELICESETNPNHDVIPKEYWQHVREVLLEKNISQRQFQSDLGSQYCGSALFKSNISRKRLKKTAHVLEDDETYHMACSDIFWEKITSIEYLGEEDVYDIEVPGLHNFVAENFIVHNSLEQDADIVMFIYRDDYYNQESERAGVADIIIAKQRSGPTGDVELLFQNNITKFKNPIQTNITGE